MKITAIKVWKVSLPLREGRYNWSNGNFVEVFDSTVVAVETDASTRAATLEIESGGMRARFSGSVDATTLRLVMMHIGRHA